MTYSLFIDDERTPPNKPPIGSRWVLVRSMSEAIRYIEAAGWPHFISFDHDLGDGEPTGMDFAKWIVDQDLENDCLPFGLTFDVHSMNPVGAENIKRLLDNYLTWRKTQKIQQLANL